MQQLERAIRAIGREHRLLVGFTDAAVLEPAASVLPHRKAAGLAGAMQFTYRRPERSANPAHSFEGARSIVAAALPYTPAGSPVPAGQARVARYSWMDHYHELRNGLGAIAERLVDAGWRARVHADDNNLVDRNVAWRAGLGWWGKNANLLTETAGSWVVLGGVLTDAVLTPGQPQDDGCGPCRRCIDGCPTDAIIGPGVVDATRCIAWLVQAAEPIPVSLRAAVGDRIYGCDDCQEVCPPTLVAPHSVAAASAPLPAEESQQFIDPLWLLDASDAELEEAVGRWYIAHRDFDVVRRTALVVLGNTPLSPDRQAVIVRYCQATNPSLRLHAIWAARRHGIEVPLETRDRTEAIDDELAHPVDRLLPH